MSIEKYYGFQFKGENFSSELVKTHLPIDQLGLDHLISDGLDYSLNLKFKALYGLIRELTLFNDDIRVNSPSMVGQEKYQAFIIKRSNDVITNEGGSFFLNGKKIELDFTSYNVTIVDFKNNSK